MKKIAVLLATLLISMTGFAQLNFSGTWKLNSSKSQLGEQFSMAPKEIIITQSANEMNVEKHSSFQDQDFITKDKFTLDGKECINVGWQDSQKKSTVVWTADKKSLTCTTKFPMNDGNEIIIKEVYKMDGASMVIQSSASSSYGDISENQVYDKQ